MRSHRQAPVPARPRTSMTPTGETAAHNTTRPVALAETLDVSFEKRYFTAIGLIGDPTAPVIGSGGALKRKS
jgi:hypothetical protein